MRVGVRLTDQTHVVAQVDGQPLQPNSLTPKFVRLLAKVSDQPRIRFHDLRHTHATHLLANNVHPKVAQERLGHSSVGITLDLYGHVLPGMRADAPARVDAAIRAAIDAPETFGEQKGSGRRFSREGDANDFNLMEGWPSGLRQRS